MSLHAGVRAERAADDEPRPKSAGFIGRQIVTRVMRERRLGFLVLPGQRDPRLDTVHRVTLGTRPLEAFGMRDAASGRHPVELAGADRLLGTETVAVHDF